jgi:hypothetical protein
MRLSDQYIYFTDALRHWLHKWRQCQRKCVRTPGMPTVCGVFMTFSFWELLPNVRDKEFIEK